MRSRNFYWTLFILLVLLPTTIFADVFFVSSRNGSDSHDGAEWSTPVKSLTRGLEIISAGDTLLVAAGDTLKGNWTITKSVSMWSIQEADTLAPYQSSGYFYMGPADGDEPIQVLLISGAGVEFKLKNCVLDGNLQGLAAPNGRGCLRGVASSISSLKDCAAKNFSQFGFRCEDNAELKMESCTARNNQWSGFFCYTNGKIKLRDCISLDNTFNGFLANGHKCFSAEKCYSENNGGYGFSITGTATHDKTLLLSNMISGNSSGGLLVENINGAEFYLERMDIINTESTEAAATFDALGEVVLKDILLVGNENPGVVLNGSGTTYEVVNSAFYNCGEAVVINESADLLIQNSVFHSNGTGVSNVGIGEVILKRNLFWQTTSETTGTVQNLELIHNNPGLNDYLFPTRKIAALSPLNFSSTVNGIIGIKPEILPRHIVWGRRIH